MHISCPGVPLLRDCYAVKYVVDRTPSPEEVPVPASDTSLTANLALAHAIAALVPGARVKCAVRRARPVESSCERRRRGLLGLSLTEHAIVRAAGPLDPLPVYFVDNVSTTGTTAAACRLALGWGASLTYADASTRRILPLSRR